MSLSHAALEEARWRQQGCREPTDERLEGIGGVRHVP